MLKLLLFKVGVIVLDVLFENTAQEALIDLLLSHGVALVLLRPRCIEFLLLVYGIL